MRGSRAMLLEKQEPDGSLTFLTHLASAKVHEIATTARGFLEDSGIRSAAIFTVQIARIEYWTSTAKLEACDLTLGEI